MDVLSTSSHDLPEVLPVFPLSGVLLLPYGRLPLNVFELRYRNMLDDAVNSDPYIGIIQPQIGSPDVFEEELPPKANVEPDLYEVGCVGEIERHDELIENRHLILIRGISRFRVTEELELHRGYRRVAPAYDEFFADRQEAEYEVDGERLMAALAEFGQEHNIAFELDRLKDLPGLALLNSIAMALPFPPAEKQALLEAPSVSDRYETLVMLMKMGLQLRERVADSN